MLGWVRLNGRRAARWLVAAAAALGVAVFSPQATELTCHRQADQLVQCGRIVHTLLGGRSEVSPPTRWQAYVTVEPPGGEDTIILALRSANEGVYFLDADDLEEAKQAAERFNSMAEGRGPEATWSVISEGSTDWPMAMLALGLLSLLAGMFTIVLAARRGQLRELLHSVMTGKDVEEADDDWDSDGPSPDQDRFARLVLDALQEAFPDEEAVYDPDRFVITVGSTTHGLGNHYDLWSSVGRREKKGVIANVAASALESRHGIPDTWQAAREHLLIRVRPASYNALVSLRAELETGEAWPDRASVRLNDKLSAELVFDGELIAASFPVDQLDDWGVSLDDAWEIARRNLQRQTTERLEEIAPGLFQSTWQDTYDAARMLLLEKVAWVKVKGDPVAFAPNRNLLLITGTEEHEALSVIAEQAEELFVAERSLSPYLFKLVEGGWDVWTDWQQDPALAEALGPLQDLQRKVEASDANEQKELLDGLHERAGTDVFVASVMLGRRDGVVERIGSWADAESLLPEVEHLALEREDDEPLFVSWAQAQRHLGSFMTPMGLSPERWKVSGVPTGEMGPLVAEVEREDGRS